jgi:signal transduction histidine kinase
VKSGSLQSRLVLLQLSLGGIIILVFACSAVWLSTRALERAEDRFLSDAASLVAESLEHEWQEDHDLQRAAAETLEQDAPPDVRVEILDQQGHLVASTSRDRDRRAPSPAREIRIRVPHGATVVASTSTRPIRNAISALVAAMAIAALPLFALVILLSRFIAARALRPLSRMAAQAERAPLRSLVPPLERPSDPSEVRTLAHAFNRLVARLEESLRAEQHFTEDAAHELRTPITVLSGELEYALSDPSLSDRHRYSLVRAAAQVRQISEVVDALLLLRRVDAGRIPELDDLAPVDLGELMSQVVRELIGRFPERGPDLGTAAEPEVMVTGHATLIESAIRNLLSNALKFTAGGQRIRASVTRRNGQGVVVVEDEGPGIAMEERQRVFDPFYRGAEARAGFEGFGLGLPILRRVARVHGGDVVVDGSELGGARFELSLPVWTPRS